MATPQLRLVTEPTVTPYANAATSSDPIARVFAHWVYMAGRNPARTKLGATRRQAINAALLLYSEEDLQLAVEGNLVDEWCMANDRHDIGWLLQGEDRIERFIMAGERLRERARRRESGAAEDGPSAVVDPAAAAAARERLREIVREVRGRMGVW